MWLRSILWKDDISDTVAELKAEEFDEVIDLPS
jgi:hypothetical protein